MRTEIVLLIVLSVGGISGFILPLRGLEIDLVSEASNNNVEDKESQLKLTTSEPGRTKELPNNRSDIDENALYEHATVTQNNQSERAFIYINQKYKKPSLHQYFRLAQSGPEFSRSFHLPPPLPQTFMQRRNEPCKSETEQVSSYYHGYPIPNISPDVASYFLPPPLLYNCNAKDTPNNVNYRGINHNSNEIIINYNKKKNVRPDFIELLKSPILRPLNTANIKVKYDGISGSRFAPPSFKDYFNKPSVRNEHNSKANILVHERKNDVRKNYGFSSYGQTGFQGKGIIQRIEEPSFEGELMIDDEPSRFHEKPQYEDKLLDQYLRDALGEQVTSKENEIVTNDCSYRDCVLQSTKTSSSITPQKDKKKPECKCGQHFKLTKKDLFISKDRPERGDTQSNMMNSTLLNPSSDVTYFKEMLTQNSKSNNINDALALNTIIKLNSLEATIPEERVRSVDHDNDCSKLSRLRSLRAHPPSHQRLLLQEMKCKHCRMPTDVQIVNRVFREIQPSQKGRQSHL